MTRELIKELRVAVTAMVVNPCAEAEKRVDAASAALLDRLEKAEKEPVITPAMIEAAESVEDLYRRGTPDTWGKVFRAMWRAMEASK